MSDAKRYCEEAAELVAGERAIEHGGILSCHVNIAAFWSAWLRQRGVIVGNLNAKDVAVMMVLLKIARTLTGKHNQDDYRDAVGYSAIAGHIADLMHERNDGV